MLIVLFGWFFAAACLFPIGAVVVAALSPKDEPAYRSGRRGNVDAAPVHLLLAGLAAAIAWANGWNYFAPVGAAAALTLLGLSLVMLFLHRGWHIARLRHWWNSCRSTPWPVLLAFAALFLLVLLKSASPSEMYDEGGYYMPYIKWIEQYRIIPGLGNIEDRLGFNSAFHMGSALFGLAWLVPGGTYDLNGLLSIAFGAWCLGGLRRLLGREKPLASDVLKLFCLFFLMRNMLTSASADLSNILLGEAIFILFLEKIEAGTTARADHRYGLIVLCSLLIATIKLSSLFVWLVPAFLTVRILGARLRPPFAKLAVCAACVILPWLGRFPVLSGYLVYPLYQIDLFHVDWKVPQAVAERQYHYVSEFAKTNAKPGESAYLAEHRRLLEWVPAWFHRENGFNRATALALSISFLGLAMFAVFRWRRLWTAHRDLLFFSLIVAANVLLWFLRNPSFRFGWAWAITFVAFAFYLALVRFRNGQVLRAATLTLFTLFLLQNTGKTLMESRRSIGRMLVQPMPVKAVPLEEVDLGDIHARLSATNQCWGTEPPCLPVGYDHHLQARGPRVEDGFRIAQ